MKSSGLYAKFQVIYPVDLEKIFEVCLTVNGRGGHLRHMTKTSRKTLSFSHSMTLNMKGLNRSSGFKEEAI